MRKTKRTGLRAAAVVLGTMVLWPLLAAPALAATLHAIFVIDTNDKNIGSMVARDLGIVGDEIQRIAQATGLTLKDRVYKGGDFTIDNVKNAVNSLSAGPDDVIFFYYSGHGFRTPPKKSDWPYFYFHSERAIDFGWVAETLSAKGARLAISLVDACNNVVNVQVREEQKGIGATADKAVNGYKELFLRHKGWVAGASSIPGETSTATASGSLFTISFLSALRHEIAGPTPSWKPLMDSAAGKRLTHRGSNGKVYSQQPFYKMNANRIVVAANPPATQPPAPQPPATQPPAVQPPQPPAPTVQFPTAGTQPPATQPPVPQPPAAQPPQQPPGFPQGQWVPIN